MDETRRPGGRASGESAALEERAKESLPPLRSVGWGGIEQLRGAWEGREGKKVL